MQEQPPGVAEVSPGLYVGGIASLEVIEKLGITHVVSVLTDPASVQHPALSTCRRHLMDVSDTEEANLLQQLPPALAFIAAALQGGSEPGSRNGGNGASGSGGSGGSSGRVLVHCAQGVSRSAAVAAAYLMQQQQQRQGGGGQLAPAAALTLLWQQLPAAEPNAGFMHQLELFHAMGCQLSESYVPYKRFLMQQAAQQYQENGCLDASVLSQPQEVAGDGATLYRCRKCRGLVCTSHNVVETEQGPGAAAFRWRKRDRQQRQAVSGGGGSGSSSSTEDGSLFVEPLRWMFEASTSSSMAADSAVGGAIQGKLYCPKCQARLGSFNWSGTQSSSGAWVTPAFQLHLSKVDAMDPRPPAVLTAIRQPRILGGGGGGSSIGAGAGSSAAAGGGSSLPAAAPAAAAEAELAAQLQRAALSDPVPASSAPPAAAASAAAGAAAAVEGSSQPSAATIALNAAAGNAPGGDGSSGSSSSSRFQCLILDCDGVLVDSERASCEALRQAILQVTGFDIPHDFPIDFQPVFGMDVLHCVEYYQQRFDRPEWGNAAVVAGKVSDVKEGIYQRLTASGITAFPGVSKLVAQARAMGMTVAVASSGSPEKIAHNLGSSGLAQCFPYPHLIVSAKHVARGKPAPDVYLETLRRLGCTDPGRALVVEDAVNGLLSAKAAGCFAVAVCTSLPAAMLAPHADLVLIHLADLDLAAVAAAAASGGSS